MSGGEPSSIKRICPCAASKPILSWLSGKRVLRMLKCGCAILSWVEILSAEHPLWSSTEDVFSRQAARAIINLSLQGLRSKPPDCLQNPNLSLRGLRSKPPDCPQSQNLSLRGLRSKPWQSVLPCKSLRTPRGAQQIAQFYQIMDNTNELFVQIAKIKWNIILTEENLCGMVDVGGTICTTLCYRAD